MQRAGVSLLDDLTQAAAIGPFDAARHLSRLYHATQRLKSHLKAQRPQLVILVDFGDFNLPVIAPMVKRYQIPILYYISPQIWAWGRWRLRFIKRYVDRMVVFFTFEEALYQQEGIPVTWVGHPLMDLATPSMTRNEATQRFNLNPSRMTVGLLPGSREDELRRHLPLLLACASEVAWHMPAVQFLLSKAANISNQTFSPLLAKTQRGLRQRTALDLHLADGPLVDALQVMDAAIIASGTATLEAAVCGTPMVVVYRTSWPTYLVGHAVVRIPHIAMVNIVGNPAAKGTPRCGNATGWWNRQESFREGVVPEFVQHRARPTRIARAIIELLRNPQRTETMKTALRHVRDQLGPPGAIDRAAAVVLQFLNQASS
jgi:lipid-A-disaccharide synthase